MQRNKRQPAGETEFRKTSEDARPSLNVDGLRKQFGTERVLSGVDVTVGADEIVALLGPSGCGKTTTLRCVAGVETPDGGEIRIDGRRVEGNGTSRPPYERGIGMVYQNYAVWPHKSVFENVAFPLEHGNHTNPGTSTADRVEEVLETLAIDQLADEPASDLSGGQQQRTALARALVYDPELLLLDEPLSNLDRELRTEMRNELQRLQHDLDISMLYVTHDQAEAFYLADRVLVMRDGTVVERGAPRELYDRPATLFTRQFVGNYNQFAGTVMTDGDEHVIRSDFAAFPTDDAGYVAESAGEGDVYWFVRPSDVRLEHVGGSDWEEITSHGNAGKQTDDLRRIPIDGTVIAEGLLGDYREITVSCSDTDADLIVHSDAGHTIERGTSVRVSFRPVDVQVYPASK